MGPAKGSGGAAASALAGLLWAAGALLLLASLAASVLATGRLARASRPFADGRVRAEARRLGRLLGLGREVRLLAGPADAMPLSWGLLRAHVMLPSGEIRRCSPTENTSTSERCAATSGGV